MRALENIILARRSWRKLLLMNGLVEKLVFSSALELASDQEAHHSTRQSEWWEGFVGGSVGAFRRGQTSSH